MLSRSEVPSARNNKANTPRLTREGCEPTDRRDARHPGERHFYGRRKGHKLSDRQQRLVDELLPRLSLELEAPAPPALSDLFSAPVHSVWLEIGFGAGEHLVWQARNHPDIGFIGCEPYINGVAKVLAAVESEGLGNLRLHADDARDVLSWLPASSIDRVFILFPDPWPKQRHRKRRFVNPENVETLARIMKPGAELRFATDIGDYVRTALHALVTGGKFAWSARSADDWRKRTDDWPETRYERKARAAGRRCYYFRFERRGG